MKKHISHCTAPLKTTTPTLVVILIMLMSCTTTVEQKATLRDIDISSENSMQSKVFVKPKTQQEIRKAYSEYLKNAGKKDKSRLTAINRLAELELQLGKKLINDSQPESKTKQSNTNTQADISSDPYNASLIKTANLLSTSLKDYTQAKGNDRILYQLAKIQDQLGRYNKSLQSLTTLVKKFPLSPHYAEAQFRLAEAAFVKGDYITAEDAYTEVIVSPGNSVYYDKALFKRGWSRYKQLLYTDAIDDYFTALYSQSFNHYDTLNKTEKEHLDEYFRAMGLVFSHLQGAKTLRKYLSEPPSSSKKPYDNSTNNNTNTQADRYLFPIYSTISDIYQQQERYSDAADTLQQFIKYHSHSPKIPFAQLKIITIWQAGEFANNLHQAIERFYSHYNPDSDYWKKRHLALSAINNKTSPLSKHKKIDADIDKSMKDYIILIANFFHNQYQEKQHKTDYLKAKMWYQRYLQHYAAYARKDTIYINYANLLASSNINDEAVYYFALAAFDGDLILNKKAAYATIVLSDTLYNSSKGDKKKIWFNKHLDYALRFLQLYPTDKRSDNIAIHAAEMAFSINDYQKTLELTEILSSGNTINKKHPNNKTWYKANQLKAQAYIKLAQFSEAETVYQDLLQYSNLLAKNNIKKTEKRLLQNGLALSIYRQAEHADKKSDFAAANHHFLRIADITPNADIAATATFDAIALAISAKQWEHAIQNAKKFQTLFPNHKLKNAVTKKLSIAYLNADKRIEAAREFEKISNFEANKQVKMAALWQAAELYEAKNDLPSAIRSYRDYANRYNKPHPQHMEAMYKLTQLYNQTKTPDKAHWWLRKIIQADKKATQKSKSERTLYIASLSAINLAKQKRSEYDRYQLVEPLRENLRKKKKAMQESVKLFGQASTYRVATITTEATYAIADIYNNFGQALLNSERPKKLDADALEQYEILLEDQAFPFEEKAIEFYEINLSKIQQGLFDNWIKKSHDNLKTLFPVRYSRKGKMDSYIDITVNELN